MKKLFLILMVCIPMVMFGQFNAHIDGGYIPIKGYDGGMEIGGGLSYGVKGFIPKISYREYNVPGPDLREVSVSLNYEYGNKLYISPGIGYSYGYGDGVDVGSQFQYDISIGYWLQDNFSIYVGYLDTKYSVITTGIRITIFNSKSKEHRFF